MRQLILTAVAVAALSGAASAQNLTITSPEFKAGGSIPSKFTCDAGRTAPNPAPVFVGMVLGFTLMQSPRVAKQWERGVVLRLWRYVGLRMPQLVNRFLPFARSLAMRYSGGVEPSEDLVQVASLGLVSALERFDPERGVPFAAFAGPTILGELLSILPSALVSKIFVGG